MNTPGKEKQMDSIIVGITINFDSELTYVRLCKNGPIKFCKRQPSKH